MLNFFKFPKNFKLNNVAGFFLTLRAKFIFSFLGIVLFLFVSFGLINFKKSEEVINRNVYSLTMANIMQISTNIDYYLKDAELLSDVLINNSDLVDYLKSYPNPPSTIEELRLYTKGEKVSSYIVSLWYGKLSGIFALSKDASTSHVIFLKNYAGSTDWNNKRDVFFSTDVANEVWYKNTLNSSGKFYVIGTNIRMFNTYNYQNVVSFARAYRDPVTLEQLGLILIDFDYDSLNSLINPQSSNEEMEKNDIYILDSNNSIMYCKNKELLTKKFDMEENFEGDASGSKIVTINGEKSYMVYYTSPNSLWKVVSLIPYNVFTNDISFIRNMVILLTLVCLFLAVIFSSQITLLILKPIKKLMSAMSKFEKGDLATRLQIKSQDETRFLADSFNSMAASIENLVNKVYLSQLKQKEAELTSLQSQINPHFLYNTLESIRGVAITCGINSISEMSKALSLFFRYSINSKHMVPISEEIKNIENYILIQNFRYEDKFDIVYDIPPELYNCRILKLTLQPLIENSIKHGLEMKIGKGKIEIKIEKADNNLIITVHDDGIGMSDEEISSVNARLTDSNVSEYGSKTYSSSGGTGIGVLNVNSRIILSFGSQYGIRYDKTEIGTLVKFIIPVIYEEERT